MIQHTLKDDILSISIANKDFSYRISLKKLGNKCNWKIGDNDSEQIIVKGVSTWALQLFTKVVTELKYVEQFKVLVQEFCPKNSIHWEDTFMAVKIQNEYNSLTQKTNPTKNSDIDKELIAQLTDKYDLDYWGDDFLLDDLSNVLGILLLGEIKKFPNIFPTKLDWLPYC